MQDGKLLKYIIVNTPCSLLPGLYFVSVGVLSGEAVLTNCGRPASNAPASNLSLTVTAGSPDAGFRQLQEHSDLNCEGRFRKKDQKLWLYVNNSYGKKGWKHQVGRFELQVKMYFRLF